MLLTVTSTQTSLRDSVTTFRSCLRATFAMAQF